ncbi:unnamed protein product [Effrenium voratum]|nr:unnamed protein product [Effrenium voratum]
MEPSRPRPRTIRIEDVVKALDIIAQRLGDGDRSCERLQAWAAEGRVTPAGQRLTPEAVAEGIQLWRAKAEPEAADRPPPTPLSSRRPSKREATQAGTSQAKEADARPDDRPKRRRRLKIMEESEPAAHSVDVAVDREACRAPPSFAERQAERKQREARLEELAETRFQELLAEIQGHMCEILRRSSSEALQEFRESTLTDPSERRELYMRLVHRQQAELRAPMQGLLPHQVEGLEWLVSLYINGLHGILADEMGLGKTIQSIALLLHLQDSGNLGPHLVVAPKSCLSNWQAEFERFAPDACVHLLAQAKESAAILRPDKVNVCITNYEQVYRNDWLLQRDWQLVIVDEGHRLKNPETLVHATMAKLRCRMRLLLTGTPLQNSVAELWALLHYLLPDLFTEMLDFKAWFAKPFRGTEENEYDVQLNPQQEQEVITQCHALLAPFLLQRLKSEVLGDSLPPRVEVTVRVPLSACQSEAYADLKKKTIRWMEDDQICSEQVNNALMQLRKIALHPYLFQDDYPRDRNLFRVSGKARSAWPRRSGPFGLQAPRSQSSTSSMFVRTVSHAS